jgi:hypothetical protein
LTSDTPSEDTKAKLQEILQLLNQDIGLLVQDAENVRKIFSDLKGQLPTNIEAALLPVAFIEGHQFKVLQAKQHLSDCTLQENLISQREASRFKASNIKTRIETLKNSHPSIVTEIDRLKARRVKLMKELETIETALTVEEEKLGQLPASIDQMEEDLNLSQGNLPLAQENSADPRISQCRSIRN